MAPKHNPQEEKAESRGLTFQDMILDLSRFWADQGCVLALPYDVEVGARTIGRNEAGSLTCGKSRSTSSSR